MIENAMFHAGELAAILLRKPRRRQRGFLLSKKLGRDARAIGSRYARDIPAPALMLAVKETTPAERSGEQPGPAIRGRKIGASRVEKRIRNAGSFVHNQPRAAVKAARRSLSARQRQELTGRKQQTRIVAMMRASFYPRLGSELLNLRQQQITLPRRRRNHNRLRTWNVSALMQRGGGSRRRLATLPRHVHQLAQAARAQQAQLPGVQLEMQTLAAKCAHVQRIAQISSQHVQAPAAMQRAPRETAPEPPGSRRGCGSSAPSR